MSGKKSKLLRKAMRAPASQDLLEIKKALTADPENKFLPVKGRTMQRARQLYRRSKAQFQMLNHKQRAEASRSATLEG